MASALGVVGLGASLFGIADTLKGGQVAAQGAEFQGASQAAMYNYQSQVAKYNATVAKQNAAYDIESGEIQAEASGEATRQAMGETKAIQGASNLDVNTGSAREVRASESAVGAENQALIRANAAKAAYGENVQAWSYTAQSTLDTQAATFAPIAAGYQAQASILGSQASALTKFGTLAMNVSGSFSGSGSSSG